MGRARLLCPCAQPHRLRARAGPARRFSGDLRRAAPVAGHRRLYRSCRRRDCVRRTGRGGRHQRPARDRAAAWPGEPARAEIEGRGAGDASRRPLGRFYPGDDGPRRDHLPSPLAIVRRLPARRPNASALASGQPEAFPHRASGRRARTATALPFGPNAAARCGWCAGRPRACSAAWPRLPVRSGANLRSKAPMPWERCGTSSPISRSTCTWSRAPIRLATAGGMRSTACPKRGFRRSTDAPPKSLLPETEVPPEPFFPAAGSTAPIPCAARLMRSPSWRSAAMRANWSGATGCRRWTTRAAAVAAGRRCRVVPRPRRRSAALLQRRRTGQPVVERAAVHRPARRRGRAAVRRRAEPRAVAFAPSLLRNVRRGDDHRPRRLVARAGNVRRSISRASTRWRSCSSSTRTSSCSAASRNIRRAAIRRWPASSRSAKRSRTASRARSRRKRGSRFATSAMSPASRGPSRPR